VEEGKKMVSTKMVSTRKEKEEREEKLPSGEIGLVQSKLHERGGFLIAMGRRLENKSEFVN
jgi:hypothetical protein